MRILSTYEGQLLFDSLDLWPTRKHTIYIFLLNNNQFSFIDKESHDTYIKITKGYAYPTLTQRDFMRYINCAVEVPSFIQKEKLRNLLKDYKNNKITANIFEKRITECQETSTLL